MGAELSRILDPAGVLEPAYGADLSSLESSQTDNEAVLSARPRQPHGITLEIPGADGDVPSAARSPVTPLDNAMAQIAPPFVARLLGGTPPPAAVPEDVAEDAEPPSLPHAASSLDSALELVAPPAVVRLLADAPESFSAGEDLVRRRQESADSPGFIAAVQQRVAGDARASPRV